jgi:hypothetical protein
VSAVFSHTAYIIWWMQAGGMGMPQPQPGYYPAPAGPPSAAYGQTYAMPPGYATAPHANGGYGQTYQQPPAQGCVTLQAPLFKENSPVNASNQPLARHQMVPFHARYLILLLHLQSH